MPGHQTHFSIGLLFYPLIFLLWSILFSLLGESHTDFFSLENVIISLFTYSLGTILPDVDVHSSLIHRIIRNLFLIPGVSVIVYYLMMRYFIAGLNLSKPLELILKTAVIYMAISVGFLTGLVFSKSVKHRGFLHSPFSAVLYGGLVYGGLKLLQFDSVNAFFLATVAASSYFMHIATDFVAPLFRRGR